MKPLPLGACVVLACVAGGRAHGDTLNLPFGGAGAPPPPWHVVGLPQQSKPYTRFEVVALEGQSALRVDSDHGYGHLVHELPVTAAGTLAWRWRVESPVHGADLHHRSGDDAALKVCAVFDLPRERVPFLERQLLRAMEARTGTAMVNAMLCYVWDDTLAAGTVLYNAFTHRIRYVAAGGPLHQWRAERHDLAADFVRAFGNESVVVPPLLAVAVGADTDNTGSHSVAFVADLRLQTP